MEFLRISQNKKEYLPLLFLADESEEMIDRYLDKGEMHILKDPDTVAVCVTVDLGGGVLEVKNLAVRPEHQGKGYGRAMLRHIEENYAPHFHTVTIGTGDSPLTVPFYERCGYRRGRLIKNFFTDNYDHEIWEDGVLLRDMVYFDKIIGSADK